MKRLIEDIAISLLVLTRVPVNGLLKDLEKVEIYRGQWAYPLVGTLIGFFIFLVIQILEAVGMPQNAAIIIALSIGIFLTGALHEDGLADFFDSLGGRDYESRQKILRDSNVGTFGVLALASNFLLRYTLISQLETDFAMFTGLLASYAIGRYSILIIYNYCEVAKQSGLTKELRKLSLRTLILCGLFSIVWVIPAGVGATIMLLMLGLALVYLLTKVVVPFSKGISGDLLGLSVQLFELLTLSIICIAFLN